MLRDGERLGTRDIALGSYLVTALTSDGYAAGLWSDGETLWVVDEFERKAYAYAAPGLETAPGESGRALPELASRATVVPGTAAGAPVWIPDPGLRARIAAALGRNGRDRGERDEGPGGAGCPFGGVSDLTGLEHAVNLEGLDLGRNPVVDLGPLASLPALRRLNLDGLPLDLWQLPRLARLTELSVRGSGLDDLGALASFSGLAVLDLSDNRIEDLGPLARLENLRVLAVGGNRVDDLSPLAGLMRLRDLDVRGNRIGDFPALSARDGLRIVGREEQRAGR